jgi:MYXO-CTERM domain-containing protein
VADFDNGADGGGHGLMVPVLYPGFNPFYAQGGWPGPTWKISYTLKEDNTEGGDTFLSTFNLGMYAGDPLQIATWNDYGEGTMIEPTKELQYRFLTTLQKAVGAVYTDAELKIVKQLFDQRRQFGASKQAQLDQASAALANLDVATACGILGCTAPVHTGAGGSAGTGAAGTGSAAGATGAAGTAGAAGATGAAGKPGTGTAGTGSATTGSAGTTGAAGVSGSAGTGAVTGQAGTGAAAGQGGGKPAKSSGGCNVGGEPGRTAPTPLVMIALALATLARRRQRVR